MLLARVFLLPCAVDMFVIISWHSYCISVLYLTGTFTFYLQASVAKLETSIALFSDKLELKVYGFNNKLPVLLSRILAIPKSFLPAEDRFKVFMW